MMHMRKAQHEDVHSTTIFTNKYKQKGYMIFMHGSVKNGTQRVCSVAQFKGPIRERANLAFSDNPQGSHISLDGF